MPPKRPVSRAARSIPCRNGARTVPAAGRSGIDTSAQTDLHASYTPTRSLAALVERLDRLRVDDPEAVATPERPPNRMLPYDPRVAAKLSPGTVPHIVSEIAHADIVFRTLGYKTVGVSQFHATWLTCLGEDLVWKGHHVRNIWALIGRLRDAGLLHPFEDPPGQWKLAPSALLKYTVTNWQRRE